VPINLFRSRQHIPDRVQPVRVLLWWDHVHRASVHQQHSAQQQWWGHQIYWLVINCVELWTQRWRHQIYWLIINCVELWTQWWRHQIYLLSGLLSSVSQLFDQIISVNCLTDAAKYICLLCAPVIYFTQLVFYFCCCCCLPGLPCNCSNQYKPVCGVNGQTYPNFCVAG